MYAHLGSGLTFKASKRNFRTLSGDIGVVELKKDEMYHTVLSNLCCVLTKVMQPVRFYSK